MPGSLKESRRGGQSPSCAGFPLTLTHLAFDGTLLPSSRYIWNHEGGQIVARVAGAGMSQGSTFSGPAVACQYITNTCDARGRGRTYCVNMSRRCSTQKADAVAGRRHVPIGVRAIHTACSALLRGVACASHAALGIGKQAWRRVPVGVTKALLFTQ